MKQQKVRYTFDVTKFKMQKSGIPEFLDIQEVLVEADNYIAATMKMDKDYPSNRHVKQLSRTSDGSWPPSHTLWPKFDKKVMLEQKKRK